MPTIMQKGHAPFKYVRTKVIQYYSCIVDLRWSRSIHSCDVCPFRSQKNASKCSSVHYGVCTPVAPSPVRRGARGMRGNVVSVPIRKISIPIQIQKNTNKDASTKADGGAIPVIDNQSAQDGEGSLFLRQKTDELNQKRQEKLKEKDAAIVTPIDKASAADDAVPVVSLPSSVADTGSTSTVLVPESIAPLPGSSQLPPSQKIDSDVASENVSAPASSELQTITHAADDASQKLPVSTAATASVSEVTLPSPPASADTDTLTTDRPRPSDGDISVPTQLVKPSSGAKIPLFYFPLGQTSDLGENEMLLQRVKDEFDKVEEGKVTKAQMGLIVKACGIPFYWKNSFFHYLGGDKLGHIVLQGFLASWNKLTNTCFDAAARFVCILAKPGRNFLEFDDFLPLVQDVVDTHPGLKFLQDAPEFHSRYVQTVISRIFYCINRSWTGRMTAQEIRKSNLLSTIELMEDEDDINQIVDYFSYEHFYVIYCKFWELDTDHDLLISKEDLSRHNDHAISSRMIDRIFSGTVSRNLVDGKLNYRDFVWFLISEEDKRHPRSVEYWFRCMDLDGDGIISMYEMEYFYEEQVQKMEILGVEILPFQDCLCQMFDMIQPKEEGKIRLKDLKKCSLTPIFFDTFFNLDKYLEHEQKDPFAGLRDREGDEPEMSDWERFAAEEYELLVAEEGANEVQQQNMVYEDELEPEAVDSEGANVESKEKTDSSPVKKAAAALRDSSVGEKDEIYDFSSDNVGC